MALIPHHYHKAISLEHFSGSKEDKQNLHSKDRDRGKEPPIAQGQLKGQLSVTSSSQSPSKLYTSWLAFIILLALFSKICLEQSARGFISIEVAICLHWRHMQEKTWIKTMISKISDNFFNQDRGSEFIKFPRLGVGSVTAFICFLM